MHIRTGYAVLRADIAARAAVDAYHGHYMRGVKHASSARSDADIVEVNNLCHAARNAKIAAANAWVAHVAACKLA